jgi:hypothetical protein
MLERYFTLPRTEDRIRRSWLAEAIDSCSGYVPEGDFDGQPHPACGGLIPMRYKLVPH